MGSRLPFGRQKLERCRFYCAQKKKKSKILCPLTKWGMGTHFLEKCLFVCLKERTQLLYTTTEMSMGTCCGWIAYDDLVAAAWKPRIVEGSRLVRPALCLILRESLSMAAAEERVLRLVTAFEEAAERALLLSELCGTILICWGSGYPLGGRNWNAVGSNVRKYFFRQSNALACTCTPHALQWACYLSRFFGGEKVSFCDENFLYEKFFVCQEKKRRAQLKESKCLQPL